MIVVFDTNIVASATDWRGNPARCLAAWAQGRFDVAVSHPLLAEYAEVVARLARRYPVRPAVDWLAALQQAGHLYFPAPRPAVTADPDDEMIIECRWQLKPTTLSRATRAICSS